MHRRSVAAPCIALIAIAAVGCRQVEDTRVPSAVQIVGRMADAYSKCKTYSDTGTVTTVYYSDRGKESEIKPFSTAMVRPAEFRFEFNEQGNPKSRYVVWKSGSDVRTWWDVTDEFESGGSLGLALAGATGVSSGSAHTIPALLMPSEVGGRMLTDLRRPTRGDDQRIGDAPCFTIMAQFADYPITIWIDQDSYLIRRIDSAKEFDDFTTQESTLYDPVIDEDVDPKLLEYNAPQ